MKHYGAPWGRTVTIMSAFVVIVCLGIAALVAGKTHGAAALGAVVPVAVVLVTALFVVRGYSLEPGELRVQRLLWATRVSLKGLAEVAFRPNVMRGSVRWFGNGGLYAFTGLFQNRELGRYRAFVTDHARTVVLRIGPRTIVVSPSSPEAFVDEVRATQFGPA